MYNFVKKISPNSLNFLWDIREKYYKNRCSLQGENSHFLKYQIPFYAKWESPDLVTKIRKGEISAKDDPLWQNSSAENTEEYESYSWQICAMACLKMVLSATSKKATYQTISLAKEAETFGVYKKNNNPNPKQNLDGMFHKPFLNFIRTLGLRGFRRTHIRENQLCHYINNQMFILASVDEKISEQNIQNKIKKTKGGHLVVIVGYKVKSHQISGFYINNPSGDFNKSQKYCFVDIAKWKNNFSGNILCLSQNNYSSIDKPA